MELGHVELHLPVGPLGQLVKPYGPLTRLHVRELVPHTICDGLRGHLAPITFDILRSHLDGILHALRDVARDLGQEPVAEARGRIINLSSQHGMVDPPGHFAYAVGKGGLVQMTRHRPAHVAESDESDLVS